MGLDRYAVRRHCRDSGSRSLKRLGLDAEPLLAEAVERVPVAPDQQAQHEDEVDVEDVTDVMIYDYLGEAYFAAGTEMKSFLQFDNIVNNMQKLGATEEELKGLQSFKKRLEKNVFDRYDVTEDDLKEEFNE